MTATRDIQRIATGDPGLIHAESLPAHADRARSRIRAAVHVHRVAHRPGPAPEARRVNPRLIRRRIPTTARLRRHPETPALHRRRVAAAGGTQRVAANDARLIHGESLPTHAERTRPQARAAVGINRIVDRPVSAATARRVNPRLTRRRSPSAVTAHRNRQNGRPTHGVKAGSHRRRKSVIARTRWRPYGHGR